MFQGIVSIIPITTITPSIISVGRFQTTPVVTVLVSGQNLGGTYSYQWQRIGDVCTINTPNSNTTTITGGGTAGFSFIFL